LNISIHKGYLSGCIGRIIELHADYYALQSGFGVYFESRVARELAAFCERYEETRDGLWLALADDQVEGAIAIDGLHGQGEGAHLRWFIASEQLRGSGIGSRLLASALTFCDERRYPKTSLWTFAGLQAARHLYEKHDFRLVHEQPGKQWGNEVMEQRFERLLPQP
jgi:GNAT superfamily N-acetyltransferase